MKNSSRKLKTIMAARSLRKNSTKAEELLWRYLDNRGMCGFKFRRQHPYRGFVLDFYCAEKHLCVELDGAVHRFRKEYDMKRQNILEENGIQVIRFDNEVVLSDIGSVLEAISRCLIPSPLCGEGKAPRLHVGEQG